MKWDLRETSRKKREKLLLWLWRHEKCSLKPSKRWYLSVRLSWFHVWLTLKEFSLFRWNDEDNQEMHFLKVSPRNFNTIFSDVSIVDIFALWTLTTELKTSKKCVISSHDNLPRFSMIGMKDFYVFFIACQPVKNLRKSEIDTFVILRSLSRLGSEHSLLSVSSSCSLTMFYMSFHCKNFTFNSTPQCPLN